MSIEQDLRLGIEESEERYANAELVNNEDIGVDLLELGGEESRASDKGELAQDGAEDVKTASYGGGKDGVAANSYVEGSLGAVSAIASFLKAMVLVPVGCEDGHFVS